MKHYRRLALLTIILVLNLVSAEQVNILFMGNSFTFRHDLPELVGKVFEEGHPGLSVYTERVVYGGQDMFRHHDLYFSETFVRLNSIAVEEIEQKILIIKSYLAAEEPPDFYDAYWEKTGLKLVSWDIIERNLKSAVSRQQQLIDRIKANDRIKWDYLVLQSWKDVVPDLDAGYCEYAEKFARIAEKEGIKVILYITAPHAQNAEPVNGPLEWEQSLMEIDTIQAFARKIKPYAVVPVALGLQQVQQNGTGLAFRYINDMHPNQYGAFLTANMFYAAFFKESTEGFDFNTVTETNPKGKGTGKDPDGGDATVVFDEKTKNLLQKAAYAGVMEFYSAMDE